MYLVSKESIGNRRSSSDFNENIKNANFKRDGRQAAILNDIKNLFDFLGANFQTN